MLEIQNLKTEVIGSNMNRAKKLQVIRYLNMIKRTFTEKESNSVIIELSEKEARKVYAKLENEREFKAKMEEGS